MIEALRSRLTYANVTATIALFFALGSGAWAVGATLPRLNHLMSPSGSYKVQVTNSGITMTDRSGASIKLSGSDLTLGVAQGNLVLKTAKDVDITAGDSVNTKAGTDISENAGLTLLDEASNGTSMALDGGIALLKGNVQANLEAPMSLLGASGSCSPQPVARQNDPVLVPPNSGSGTIIAGSPTVLSC